MSITNNVPGSLYSRVYGRWRYIKTQMKLKTLNSLYSFELSMVELYSNYLSDDKLDFIEKFIQTIIIMLSFLGNSFLKTMVFRMTVPLFLYLSFQTMQQDSVTTYLRPSKKSFYTRSPSKRESLKLRYNKLLKFSPPKDKQAIMQLKICISSHIAHGNRNSFERMKNLPLILLD